MRPKKKRKLIIDKVISISDGEMKNQLSDTSDLIMYDWSPPTKKLMRWKETTGVEKLFGLPGYHILSKPLSILYLKHLTTQSVENEEFFEEEIKTAPFDSLEKESCAELNRVSKELSADSDHCRNSPINVSNYSKSSSSNPSVVLVTHDPSESHNETDASQ